MYVLCINIFPSSCAWFYHVIHNKTIIFTSGWCIIISPLCVHCIPSTKNFWLTIRSTINIIHKYVKAFLLVFLCQRTPQMWCRVLYKMRVWYNCILPCPCVFFYEVVETSTSLLLTSRTNMSQFEVANEYR